MSRKLLRSSVPLLLLALFFGGYVAYPLYATVLESLRSGEGYSLSLYHAVLDPRNAGSMEAMANSLLVSSLSVIFSGIVGVLLAFTFTQCTFPFRSTLQKLAVVPIALPPLVGVIAFLFVFGESGILPRVVQHVFGLREIPFSLDGISAIVGVHVYSFYVYFFLFVSTALRQLDASVMEAAAGLGSSPWRTFHKVVLPHLRPSLTGAAVLTFMSSMASFSAPLLFGGGRRFLTLEIYTSKLNGDLDVAAVQAVVLTVISLVFFLLLRWTSAAEIPLRSMKGTGKGGVLPVGRMARTVLLTASFLVLALETLPLLTIVLVAFAREGSWTWQILPAEYTSENFTRLFTDPRVFLPVSNSLVMAALALVLVLAVGVTAAYMTTKGALRNHRTLFDVLLTLPYAVPGTVIAMNLILSFNHPSILTGYSILVGSFWILPLAYAIRTYPLVLRSTSAALEHLDDSLLEAAESFGAGGWRRFRKIALPIILPAIVSGAVLASVAALGEFVSSILLYTYDSRPISVEILAQLRMFSFGSASAYAVVLLVLILAVVGAGGWISRRSLSS